METDETVKTSTNYAIFGYSGHGFVVVDAAILSGLNQIGYVESNPVLQNPHHLPYVGFEKDINFFEKNKEILFIHGVGENLIRHKIGSFVRENGGVFVNIIHPKAIVSSLCSFGSGNFVSGSANVNCLAKIGDDCIINTGAIVEHECELGNTIHIAPGSVLAGNVKVGDRTFIGAGAVVRPGITIGKDVIVGAGAVVVKDIPDGEIVVGNPAKLLIR